MRTELDEACERLANEAGARKVLLCGAGGEVVAHSGSSGLLDDPSGDVVAGQVGDLLAAGASAPAETVVALGRGRSAYAAPVGGRAALVAIFDETSTLERVRLKVRRALQALAKMLEAAQEEPNLRS